MKKIDNLFVLELIDAENPFPQIWQYMVEEIWNYQSELKDYYRQEKQMRDFELFLVRAYDEIFTDLLPKYCTGVDPNFDDDTTNLFLDSLSLREAILLQAKLEDEYDVELDFSYSALPSETAFYKEKISYKNLGSSGSHVKIQDLNNFSLSGDESFIWSDFPDARLESLSKGRTVLDAVSTAYKEIEELVFSVMEQLKSSHVIIRSDHGYVRHQPDYSFSMNSSDKKEVKNLLGGGRFIEEDQVGEVPEGMENYIVSYNGYYMAKGRYVWPVAGKYKKFQHGGVSLLECMTPVLQIKKR